MNAVSEHDLWGAGSNRVVALPPSPDDLFVVTTLFGKPVLVQPVCDYVGAVRVAEAFTRHIRQPQPLTVKVLCVTLEEGQAMGFMPKGNPFEGMPMQAEAELRHLVVTACTNAATNSTDAKVRADALKLLKEMGALK